MSYRSIRPTRSRVALLAVLGLVLAACGAQDAEPESGSEIDADAQVGAQDEGGRLHVVATTSILGDIVGNLVQEDGDVTVLMGPGVDPHGYAPAASDAAVLREADLVVANGLMLEENLVSMLDAAAEDGANVLEVADQLDPIEFDLDGPGHGQGDDDHGHDDGHEDDDHGHEDDDHGHEDDDHGHSHDEDDHSHDDDGHSHGDDGHAHEDDDHAHDEDDHGHGDDEHGHDDHDHGPEDPHVWFDPIRMADGIRLIAAEIAAVDTTLDADEWEARGEAYADELLALHEEMEAQFATIDEADRVLVTNHDALGYLAYRYDLTVLGTVVPGSSTQAEQDAGGFAELIETVEEAGVEVIFAENTDSTVLAEQLASEVVGRSDLQVEVVRIYTDALGEEGSGADTYLGLLRTNAELITDALS